MTLNCCKCHKEITENEILKTDEFREFKSEVKIYCKDCFLEGVRTGFGHYEVGDCSVCNSSLVLEHEDEETISLAQEDFTVHFVCEKVKAAMDNGHEIEVERLDQENHDWLILYTIEPDPEESDFG